MERGKLHEELSRLREVVAGSFPRQPRPAERVAVIHQPAGGAEIARQVATALADGDVNVWFVTHNHRFAVDLFRAGRDDIAFDGTERSLRIEGSAGGNDPRDGSPRQGHGRAWGHGAAADRDAP